jgi:hypothetical protein
MWAQAIKGAENAVLVPQNKHFNAIDIERIDAAVTQIGYVADLYERHSKDSRFSACGIARIGTNLPR